MKPTFTEKASLSYVVVDAQAKYDEVEKAVAKADVETLRRAKLNMIGKYSRSAMTL